MGYTAPVVLATDLPKEIKDLKIAVLTARWNDSITQELENGAIEVLKAAGIEHILTHKVPGAFELPLGAQFAIESQNVHAVICLGCLIKGETPHFEYIADSVTKQISNLSMRYMRPVIFGVLTVLNLEQAQDRIGGKEGHKGQEAAQACLEMLLLWHSLKNEGKSTKVGF